MLPESFGTFLQQAGNRPKPASLQVSIQLTVHSTKFILITDLIFSSFGSQSASVVTKKNQSVEHTGVAFVKGANERNEFFEKIKKQ